MPRAEFQRLQPSGLDEQITRQDLEGLQQNIQQMLDDLYELAPKLDGHILETTLDPFVDNDIPHKLGRKLEGWMIVRDPAATCDFSVFVSSAQIINAGSEDVVEFDDENHDEGEDFSTSTFTFTVPVAGLYEFSSTVGLSGVSEAPIAIELNVGGAGVRRGVRISDGSVGGTTHRTHISCREQLSQGDMVTITLDNGDGSNRSVQTGSLNSWFQGRLIRETWDQQRELSDANKELFLRLRTTHKRDVSIWVF